MDQQTTAAEERLRRPSLCGSSYGERRTTHRMSRLTTFSDCGRLAFA